MISKEVEEAAGRAGFARVTLHSPFRAFFTRGDCILVVYLEGDWQYYGEFSGNKPDSQGSEFKSLLAFLTSESIAGQPRT